VGQSLVPGGTVLLNGADQYAALPGSRNVLREIDLASNVVRETNIAAVNAELTAMGHDVIHSFTHDVQRLPNGGTAVIGLTERTVNINGTPTDYVGNMIVVLDENFQVTWTWDAFDHLDVNRGPVLGEVVPPGGQGPTAAVPRLPAVDWLHLNAESWSPADQNLVLSIRHQDWVIKIDYANGEGDGHVIWRLGQGGDFAVNSTDPNPWFSHQHNAHYIDNDTLILFDNGNTRRASDPTAHSRGQVWKLDEETMTATLVVNADLGSYSGALGASQRLSNGDYSFTLGSNGPEPPRPPAHTIEVTANGTKLYDLKANKLEYRTFRVRTLYEGTGDVLAGGTLTVNESTPQLGPPQSNGGPTQTMALHAGSPAIDAGDNTGALAYDQRAPGFPRIVGGAIDIGAFEVQTAVAPQASSFAVSGFPASTTAGTAGSFTFTAKNADGTTATGYTGMVHFSSSDGQAVLPAKFCFHRDRQRRAHLHRTGPAEEGESETHENRHPPQHAHGKRDREHGLEC